MHRLATLRTFLPKQRWFSIATRQAVRHNIPFRPAIDPWRMQQPIARRSISQTIQNLKASEKPVKQSSTPGNDATAATSTTESFVMEDDLETLDPKEYPELYPEASEEEDDEQIDTEWFVQEDEHDFVPMWQRQAVGDHLKDRWSIQEVSRKLMETGDLSVDSIRDLLEENKMENIKVLDVRGRCDWTDYMVIADSSRGDRFLSSVADNVGQVIRKAIRSHPDVLSDYPMPHIEGRDDQSGWLLIDLGRCVVHLFTPEMRERYNLEELWQSVPENPMDPIPGLEEDEIVK